MVTTHHHHGDGLKHYHDEEMQSVSLKTDKPLNPDKFFPWMQDLVAKDGPNILRCKGILSFKDDPERFVVQGVHMILEGDHQRPWRRTRRATAASSSSDAICPKKKSAKALKAASPNVSDTQAPIPSLADRVRPVNAGAPVVGVHFFGSTPVFVLGEEALLFRW